MIRILFADSHCNFRDGLQVANLQGEQVPCYNHWRLSTISYHNAAVYVRASPSD